MDKKFSDLNHNYISIQDTPWDEKVLGIKSCNVKIDVGGSFSSFSNLFEQVNLFLSDNDYKFIQVRYNSNDKDVRRLLGELGYYIAEMSYSMCYNNPQKFDLTLMNRIEVELVKVSSSDIESVELIKKIASSDFHHGRMIEDININENIARQRAENWIEDLLDSPFSLYKALFRGTFIGFHAERLDSDNRSVNWILTGVSSEYSVYALPLWCAAFKLAQDNQVQSISTMISWAYYGSIAWGFLVGESKPLDLLYKLVFCIFTAIGASVSLDAVIAISDSMFFSMAIANIIGLYLLAPQVKTDLRNYQQTYCSK